MLHTSEVTFILRMNSIPFLEDTTFIHANVGNLGCVILGAITVKIFSEQQHMLSRHLVES